MVQYLKQVDSPHHAFAHGLHDGARDWQNNSVRIIVPGEPAGPGEVGTAQGIYLIGYVLGQSLAKNVPGHLSQMDPGEHFRSYLSRLSPRKREQIYGQVLACALGGIGEAHPEIDPTPEDWAAARAEADRICGPLPGAMEAAHGLEQ